MDDQAFNEGEWLAERQRLFRHVTWACLAMIALLFVAGVYWMAGPDAYHDSLAQQQAEGPRWPDGSPRTPDDWWADPGLAQAHPGDAEPPERPLQPGG